METFLYKITKIIQNFNSARFNVTIQQPLQSNWGC